MKAAATSAEPSRETTAQESSSSALCGEMEGLQRALRAINTSALPAADTEHPGTFYSLTTLEQPSNT